MLTLRIGLTMVAFFIGGYIRAAKTRDEMGRTPWGWHPVTWGFLCSFSLLLGVTLMAVAGRSDQKRAATPAWGAPGALYGQVPSGHGAVQPYGQQPYGAVPPQAPSGAVQPQYGAVQPQYGAVQAGHIQQYGQPPPPHGIVPQQVPAGEGSERPQPARGWRPTTWEEPGPQA